MSKTLLELNSLSKKFSNRQILDTISLNINVQTLNILIGENGAGKSTLAHILAGVFHPDTGTILLDGSEVKLNSPLAAHQHGIYTLYQETSLFENFTVGENILHNCASPNKFKSKKQLHQRAQEILDLFGIPLQSRDIVSSLNLPLKRMVELASIINKKPKLLILDEPTISFTNIEIEKICDLLLQYKKQGGTVLFITQKFSPVFHIADTITVLKKGRITGKKCSCNTDYNDLISMLAGEQCHHSFPKLQVKKGKEIFAVENMGTATFLKDISFSAKSGEIIGITGMVGSGKTMVARTILGLEKKIRGSVYVDRLRAEIKDPKEAMKLGIAYVAENRIEEGLFGNLNIFDNIAIQSEVQHKPFLMHSKKQRHLLKKYLTKMNLCPSITSQSPSSLSSGNQQKLLLLRSFLTGAKVFLFDEPTKGIDISTKLDIYNIMNDLTRKGAAIILISSDFEELKGMCDRLLVLKDGAISGEIAREDISYEAIYRYASI